MFLLIVCFLIIVVEFTRGDTCSNIENCKNVVCKPDESNAWITALLWFDLNQKSFDVYWRNLVESILLLSENGYVWSEDSWRPHVTFQYLCCYSSAQYSLLISTLKKVKWKPLNITFDRLVCNDDTHDNQNTTSIILRLSNSSQIQWAQTVKQFESAIVSAGLPLHRNRSQQEFFHATDAVVARSYPTASALSAINKRIPQWTDNNEPIVVSTLLFIPWPLELFHATK